jgi:hypothetical protein
MGLYFQICFVEFLLFRHDGFDPAFDIDDRGLRGRRWRQFELSGEEFALKDFADACDAGDVHIEAVVEVPVGLELAQFGHVAAHCAFGVVADALGVGAGGVLKFLAELQPPVSADDLGDERRLHHVYWPEPGFELFGCVVEGGTEDELQRAHGRVSFSSEIAVSGLRRRRDISIFRAAQN